MNLKLLLSTAALVGLTATGAARADNYQFFFAGPGVSGSVTLTYGMATDSKTPSGYEITGVSGNFSDSNNGLNFVNQTITGLVPINHATPESTNLLAPNDFSKYSVATGLSHGNTLSFDNLYYPGGSPQTASDYPFHGGFLDIYGLLFTLGNGDVVDLWSNGVLPGMTFPDYGVAVANPDRALDYVGNGVVAPTPEPGSMCLLGTGIAGLVARRRILRKA